MAPAIIEVDFTGAPPAQGGGGSSHIPRGRYALKVIAVDANNKSGAGNRMPSVQFIVLSDFEGKTEQAGARLRDQFWFPKAEGENMFGLQRFHAFLLAIGMKLPTPKVKFDMDALIGRAVYADVDDNEMPADPEKNRPARVNSQPVAYYSVAPTPAQPAAPEVVAAAPITAVAAEVVAAPVAPAPVVVAEVAPPAPVAQTPAPAAPPAAPAAAAPEPVAVGAAAQSPNGAPADAGAEVEQAIDALFS